MSITENGGVAEKVCIAISGRLLRHLFTTVGLVTDHCCGGFVAVGLVSLSDDFG